MVSIICCTMRQKYLKNVFNNYNSQNLQQKELIIILNRRDMDINEWLKEANRSKSVSVYQLPEKFTLGECLNYGIKKARYKFIAKFDDDDYYAPFYLSRSMRAFKKTSASVVAKKSVYMYFIKQKTLAIHMPGHENKFVKGGVKGATLIFKKKVCKKIKFPQKNLGEDAFFIKKCIQKKYKIYAGDRYNYVCLRRPNISSHTWHATNKSLVKKCSMVCKTNNYQRLITKFG
ncbi:glycosyltransferase family A protein [Aneurinibacillus sp. Ricciae_BoGa-3]|uniref:glycosyltransferase family A protein n=1 Tax=Aneurinibacillus sp. Ricciae_BoGa-3 TaxID=3022697 RepID=UPI00234001CB|nr:glycosyltransferase family A protein [Aneurinibacillus sp. Ricciae_BoGa-3]WCK56530.1 glycosyltransferase family A protein [Aneurinibacillus sp. Ricciae_BoGa-3]